MKSKTSRTVRTSARGMIVAMLWMSPACKHTDSQVAAWWSSTPRQTTWTDPAFKVSTVDLNDDVVWLPWSDTVQGSDKLLKDPSNPYIYKFSVPFTDSQGKTYPNSYWIGVNALDMTRWLTTPTDAIKSSQRKNPDQPVDIGVTFHTTNPLTNQSFAQDSQILVSTGSVDNFIVLKYDRASFSFSGNPKNANYDPGFGGVAITSVILAPYRESQKAPFEGVLGALDDNLKLIEQGIHINANGSASIIRIPADGKPGFTNSLYFPNGVYAKNFGPISAPDLRVVFPTGNVYSADIGGLKAFLRDYDKSKLKVFNIDNYPAAATELDQQITYMKAQIEKQKDIKTAYRNTGDVVVKSDNYGPADGTVTISIFSKSGLEVPDKGDGNVPSAPLMPSDIDGVAGVVADVGADSADAAAPDAKDSVTQGDGKGRGVDGKGAR